jgi:hypothetical protein
MLHELTHAVLETPCKKCRSAYNLHVRDTFQSPDSSCSRRLSLYKHKVEVAGSSPDEVIGFFSIDLILPAALGPGVYSASNRNEYKELIK